jgi:hypothetical protein
MATLQFLQQRDGVEQGVGAQQRDDLGVPHPVKAVFAGAPAARWRCDGKASSPSSMRRALRSLMPALAAAATCVSCCGVACTCALGGP